MKHPILFLAIGIGMLFHVTVATLYAQNVGINPYGSAPNAAAMLDIDANNKGLLIPRVSLVATYDNYPIGSGIVASLLVYNTNTYGYAPNNVVPGFYYWDGAQWVALNGGNSWGKTGNAGTSASTNFIGTTDAQPLLFKVNSLPAGYIDVDSFYASNTSLGYQALRNPAPGYNNTTIGYNTLISNTVGHHNTTEGVNALYNNTTGYFLTAIGYGALYSNTTSPYHTAVGYKALYSNTTGYENTSIGYQSLFTNTSGFQNTVVGKEAMFSNTVGGLNVAVGSNAMYSNTSGSSNSAFGHNALFSNTTGSANTAIGMYAMYSNTTGSDNTVMGTNALLFNTTGVYNTALGDEAMHANTTGSQNTAAGAQALCLNTTGQLNSAFGNGALHVNTTGVNNAAFGSSSLSSCTTGSTNTAIGTFAGSGVSTGSGNVFIGYQAGANETGSNKLYINNTYADPPLIYGDFSSQRIGLGTTSPAYQLDVADRMRVRQGYAGTAGIWFYQTTPAADKAFVGMVNDNQVGFYGSSGAGWGMVMNVSSGAVGIGTTSPDQLLSVYGNASKVGGGSWATFSDKRLKKDIKEFNDGLDILKKINPKKFKYNGLAGYPNDGKEYVGVIAQDIKAVAPYMIETIKKKMTVADTNETDLLMYDGSAMTYILINSVKEQQKIIESLEKRIEVLEKK